MAVTSVVAAGDTHTANMSPSEQNLRAKIANLSDADAAQLAIHIDEFASGNGTFHTDWNAENMFADIRGLGRAFYDGLRQEEAIEASDTLNFWKALPGGKEYLKTAGMKKLDILDRATHLGAWLDEHPEVTLITELNLNKEDKYEYGKLKFLSPEIGRFTQLRTLNLAYNELRALPSTIGQLRELEVLNVRGNSLHELPAEIVLLTHLRDLDLHGNNLTQIAPGF